MQELKEKLLSLDVFEDNEYLDFYCTLIERNRETKKEKFKTEKHHIIPAKYFKINNLKVDNSKSNLVNLLYKDHVLAHYYLYLCSKDKKLKASNRDCVVLMLGRENISAISSLNLDVIQEIHEEYRKKDSERMKNNKINLGRIVSDEEREKKRKISKALVQNGLWKNPMKNPENIEKMRQTLKLRYANGTLQGRRGSKHTEESKKLMSEHCIMHQQKYRDNLSKKLKGRIPWNKGKKGLVQSPNKNKKAIHKNNVNKYVTSDELEKYLNDGWILGGKSFKIKK